MATTVKMRADAATAVMVTATKTWKLIFTQHCAPEQIDTCQFK